MKIAPLAVIPLLAGFTFALADPPAVAEATVSTPNIVIFITDDQAADTLDVMPVVSNRLAAAGVTLSNGWIPTSLCCPSRAALLSGQVAHTTGVYENTGTNGGWPTFQASGAEDRTIAVKLHDAGYRTGLFGKYLNGFGGLRPAGYLPPGWDSFRALFDPTGNPQLSAGAYYDYDLIGTGPDEWHGNTPNDYSTDVVTDESVKFVESTSGDQPLFLYYSTTGPHAPFTPAPRHEGTWHPQPLNPAAYTLTKRRPKWRTNTLVDPQIWIAKQQAAHEALMSVDEGIDRVMDALGPRVSNTLFVFLSDNGLQYGEHGLVRKNEPYSGATQVPMIVRWDGVFDGGTTSNTPTTNVDLTATIADAAGVTMPDPDGTSLLEADRPTGVTLEATRSREHPAYCGYRTERFLYVQYQRGQEFFDYKVDPNELVNKVRKARYANEVATMRNNAMIGCDPVPPGFEWDEETP